MTRVIRPEFPSYTTDCGLFFNRMDPECLVITAANLMSHVARYTCKHLLCDLQDCCDCCSLGLQLRREGHQCEAHHYLSFHCKHAFMICCMGEENTGGGQDQWHSPVREKPALTSSPPPQKGRPSATLTQGERSL